MLDANLKSFTQFPVGKDLKDLISPYKTIIFDMDGTLLNTENLHAYAIVSILPKQSISFTKEEVEKHFHGMNDRMVYSKMIELGVQVPFTDAEAFVEAKNQGMVRLFQENRELLPPCLKPEIKEALSVIKAEKKLLMLVTASEKVVTEALLKALDLYQHFDQVITAYDTHQTKPCASPYFLAMRRSGAFAHEHLIFEDSQTGLAAAIESGAKVIKASWYH